MNDHQDSRESIFIQSFEEKSDAQISSAIHTMSETSAGYRMGKAILAERKRARDHRKHIFMAVLALIGLSIVAIGVLWNIYAS